MGQQIAVPEKKRGGEMTNVKKERWVELCEQIAEEKNPQKMIELTRELNKILTDRVDSPHKTRLLSTSHEESST
jgi:hypothetical protein